MTLADFLKNIADGIREKEKSAKPIAAAQYASRLKALQTINDEFDAVLMIHARADDGNIYGIESYKSLTIVEGAVGSKAFTGYDALENVTIGNGVTAIEEQAFYNCRNLTKVTIGNGVERIGNSAFENCQSLVNITYIGTMAEWEAIKKDSYWNLSTGDYTIYCIDGEIGKITVDDTEGSIGLALELNYDGMSYSVTGIGTCTDTDIIVPRFYDSKFITSIGYEAFSGCSSLTSITIPDSVTEIGSYAFEDCTSLTSINIPNSVTSIGNRAFYECTSLTSINIPNSVTSIKSESFYNCESLTNIIIPNSVTSIEEKAFAYCESLTNIIIGNGVTNIANDAFRDCEALISITVDENNTVYHSAGNCLVETASKTLLLGCNTSVIPDDGSVTNIAGYAFYYCSSLTSITIPDSVTNVGPRVFYGCSSLTNVIIGNGITNINKEMFCICESLISITIPDSVTSIEEGAFAYCESLTSITLPNSITSIAYDAFYRWGYNHITINVPWSEGAVEGAPWGAAYATINYNYSEE